MPNLRRLLIHLRSRIDDTPPLEFGINAEGVRSLARNVSGVRVWTCLTCGKEFPDAEFEAHLDSHFRDYLRDSKPSQDTRPMPPIELY